MEKVRSLIDIKNHKMVKELVKEDGVFTLILKPKFIFNTGLSFAAFTNFREMAKAINSEDAITKLKKEDIPVAEKHKFSIEFDLEESKKFNPLVKCTEKGVEEGIKMLIFGDKTCLISRLEKNSKPIGWTIFDENRSYGDCSKISEAKMWLATN